MDLLFSFVDRRLYKMSFAVIFLCLFTKAATAQQKPCAYTGGTVDYLPAINCIEDLNVLQSTPLKSTYAGIKSVKLVYDLYTKAIYYTNSVKYRFHYDFCSTYLNAYNTLEEFNRVEYSNVKYRKFAICNINYYTFSEIYTLEFFPDDEIPQAAVQKLLNKIKQTSYFAPQLKIANNNWHTQQWAGVFPLINPDELHNGQHYQAMQTGTAYGYLRFFSNDSMMQKNIRATDIAVLDHLPNNLPLCAATITTVFQTPLCHINILSQNRNTPNCMIKAAFTDKTMLKYKDKLVRIKILSDSVIIDAVAEKEAKLAWDKGKKKTAVMLSCDNDFRRLADLKDLSVKSINTVGGKAANMGELAKIKIHKKQPLPIPEIVFAIPFYFYNQHIQQNHIQPLITDLLNDSNIINDKARLAVKLKQIRDSIEHSPLDAALVKMVIDKIGAAKDINFRFRSSTNAEDVPGFNGAGLYDSKTGCVTSDKKPVDKAIKEVWSSLWKQRAFEERVFFNIDQHNAAMGILVNKAFGTEEANGVAVTKNLYRNDYPAFTINVQKGEVSIVQPDDSTRAEQFLINLSSIVTGIPGDLAVDYICYSSLQPGTSLLSKEEVKELSTCLLAIKDHFWKLYRGRTHAVYDNFGMDVEFKLDRGTRKLFIKQARVY